MTSRPAETLQLGAVFELSGPVVAVGQPSLDGVQLAVDEINERGGFTVGGKCYDLEIKAEDNRSDASATIAAMRGLVDDDKVGFVFGPTSGLTAQEGQEITQSADPPVIEFSAGVLWESTGLLGKPDKQGLFRSALGQGLVSSAFMKGLQVALPDAKTIYFLWRDDDVSTATLDKYLVPAAEEMGYEIVGDDRFPPDTTDFASLLGRVRSEQPDVLSVGYLPPDITAITRQATQTGVTSAIQSFNGPISIPLEEAIGKPIPQAFVAGYQAPNVLEPQTPAIEDFVSRYTEQFDKEPSDTTFYALWYYDPVYMLVRAMQLAESTTDRAKIREELAGLRWTGALGGICWTDNQIINYGTDTALVQDGEVTWNYVPIDASKCS